MPLILNYRYYTVGCKKKTGTVRIKLTHFYNFFIVWNLLTRDAMIAMTFLKII
jgi:hypothetical protein